VSSSTWTPRAVESEASKCRLALWRAVEAQHVATTRRLVDSNAEQEALERILEEFKPKPPAAAAGLHYLLATPFRYPPADRGSRFRALTDPGVFYGAEERRTACAELGYWRWRFVTDSAGLSVLGPAPQTLFQAVVRGLGVDLRRKPFSRQRARWTDPESYGATQSFAAVARQAAVNVIRYESVRDPGHGGAAALLDPACFEKPAPLAQQTWFLTVTRTAAAWRRDAETFEFSWPL
jgi:hypothetical protein